ncbi:MAG: hypothetical protein JWP33_1931, partial [Blastococcus sp.]|nr:hypothetical protein [Blastococcus sp.]MCW2683265.1 hypothetical protein [Blastococcus sp.]MCW2684018.1 hypothetical protein [Blastococcus sp.]
TAQLQVNGSVGVLAFRPSTNTTATLARFTSFSARPVT